MVKKKPFQRSVWVQVKPGEHPVTSREVDVLVGAEGKHVTLPGFRYNTASLNERRL
jgi:hypothetical protein